MKSQINLGSIGPIFLFRIMIIVAGSWGIIFVFQSLYNELFPSVTKRIIQLVHDRKSPSIRYDKKPLLGDELDHEDNFDQVM
jgi:hypothetical protein